MTNPGRRTGSRIHYPGLIAYENGQRFDEWTTEAVSGGAWSQGLQADYQGRSIAWDNAAGVAFGLARFRKGYSSFNLPASGDFEDAHTVHARVNRGNTDVRSDAIAPATVLHATGNGYIIRQFFFSVAQIGLLRLNGGVFTPLGGAIRVVRQGDIISLSYRYNTVLAEAELTFLVNGVERLFVTDSTPLRMSAVSGLFGLYGQVQRAIPASDITGGDQLYEWWVTEGFLSGSGNKIIEPPSLSQTTSGFRIAVMGRERYLDSPLPSIRKLISGPIIQAKWSHQRIGGNRDLSARIKYPEISAAEHFDAKSFSDPTVDDWETGNWLGGEVVLEYHYFDYEADETAIPDIAFMLDDVWRGRITEVSVDVETNEIKLRAEGLVADLDVLHVSGKFEQTSLRSIIETLIQSVAKTSVTGGRDSYVRYNASKIVGFGTVLDTLVDIEFQNESFSNAMDRLLEFLPLDVVWGVDRHGEFFVDQELNYYTQDNMGTGTQHFEVDGDAVKFKKRTDLTRLRTKYVVLGDELDDPQPGNERVIATAGCDRSRELYGLRSVVHQESDVPDPGTAGKIAATRLKSLLLPLITAKLTVSDPVREDREMWQTLVNATPRVRVTDRTSLTDIGSAALAVGVDDYKSTEYTLRMFGDSTAYACGDKGSNSGGMSVPGLGATQATAKEQSFNRSWLVHIVLRNEYSHPGVSGDFAFLFGRPRASSAQYGWGGLWWRHDGGTNGKLIWRYYDSNGAANRVHDTGITLDPTAAAKKTVHFTVWRDSAGVFRFYDGNVLMATVSGFESDTPLTGDDRPWRFWDHAQSGLPATDIDGDAVFDQFWVIDSGIIETQDAGVVGFISNAHTRPLPRNRAHGLVRYAPLNEQSAQSGSPQLLPCWVDDGGTVAVVTVTWIKSEGAGTGGLTALSQGKRGLLLGKEKRWGGPLVFSVNEAEFSIDGSTGIITRSMTLNELPVNLITNVAVLQQEISRLNESLRKVETL